MEDIYQMVHNQTTIKRAIEYVREGRILFIDRQSGSEERYTARVRGHYGVYDTWYEETKGEIRGGCTCMAHARTNAPCKHVVALMIQNVMEMEHERQEKQWRQEQERRRQEEEKRRKAEEKRLNGAFVDQTFSEALPSALRVTFTTTRFLPGFNNLLPSTCISPYMPICEPASSPLI